MNQSFIENSVFDKRGQVIWYKIKDARPKVEYQYKRSFSSSDIWEDLENGIIPIVKVKFWKRGIWHWVTVVGATEDDYLIMDPLEKSRKLVPLSRHGKIYAYRKIVPRS